MIRRLLVALASAAALALACADAPAQHDNPLDTAAQELEQGTHEVIQETEGGHDAHAGGAHGKPSVIAQPEQGGAANAIITLVVFSLVAIVLGTGVWPKIAKGLDERNAKIAGEIEAAEIARKQAKEALEEYEANLADARAEARRMLDETRAEQAELAAQLRAKNDAELAELRDRARQDIEAAKKAAVNEIHAHAVALAAQMAGKILEREISVQDQQRLIDESLAQMQANA